jgi:hypothetical protein
MVTRAELEAARDVLKDHGIYIALPWERDLFDVEKERFEGLKGALEAAARVRALQAGLPAVSTSAQHSS